ncbi:hypothetical protein [Deinococcus hopiensis]|uniref:Uncharacterized protein n=1 Tax=Deinococcus hopiensis KR-140 TaxID=695939 RepID=A0A1W1VNH6_9DEIO|nr:hypothetical protein [Deinococcus hopiensis]SMB94878.1 hypothetical protein SAMN00790413_02571 [Deinococcus hopiensis KR-140]
MPVAPVLGQQDRLSTRAQSVGGTLREAGVPLGVWTNGGGHTHPQNWPEVRAEALAGLAAAGAKVERSDGPAV